MYKITSKFRWQLELQRTKLARKTERICLSEYLSPVICKLFSQRTQTYIEFLKKLLLTWVITNWWQEREVSLAQFEIFSDEILHLLHLQNTSFSFPPRQLLILEHIKFTCLRWNGKNLNIDQSPLLIFNSSNLSS